MDSNKQTYLSEAFLDRMKDMLKDDFDAFCQAYEQPRTFGLRVNTAKISCEDFEKIVPFEVKKIPWFQMVILQGRDTAFQMSPLSGRAVLSSGAQCHDTSFQDSCKSGRICS